MNPLFRRRKPHAKSQLDGLGIRQAKIRRKVVAETHPFGYWPILP